MLSKRIIPCLDIKDGQTVKGVQFEELRFAGDPVELGEKYAKEGADELVFLDITATHEKRKTLKELALRIAKNLNIPFTVGGGVSSVEDVSVLLEAGADKVTINSAAVLNPKLIKETSKRFGNQCIVIAIDAKMNTTGRWEVHTGGGRKNLKIDLFEWAKEAQERGAGEILFTSMSHDGTKNGFACDVYSKLNQICSIPIIASGGAGNTQHFVDVFNEGKADAALAASIFHFGEIPVPVLKKELSEKGIHVRI
ncbi:imidazoleglycerol phosphate synthase, cyclase subunit [Bernardetia litoralis DSM 6794]|uniref:Imidazole glycerol phosphate synthase subunit HisF n=1 Tax=Bernardetia litoralis (strain ATCC 23117 / DSM 6794 / NBRC 15988 / NCIMB 1366 / Fx l1 / Sio-4) TaxID=880071 RepID=I4APE2_BERLS|nr:imidazole glycerol phosphate synthase subunit HisF [Bernardetia litoralis]AFM05827.1 imidazoleglycerol phosphate synthase, cyclase subunit [Bernardetia litoralis DSM 6794]